MTLAAEGQAIVQNHQDQRTKLAQSARITRSAHRQDSALWAGLRPEYVQKLKDYFRTETYRTLAKGPERLASRQDILRYADQLGRWAEDVDQNTNWDALWCGQQDALADRLHDARLDAKALRAYAATLKGGR